MSLALAQDDVLAGLRGAAEAMLRAQGSAGEIPWFDEGPWDPWNHAECVMALGVMGELEAADAGMDFLEATQGADGAWLGEYGNALPMQDHVRIARIKAPAVKDSNFIAYPAVAVWHRYRLTGDAAAAKARWPMVRAAVDFVVALQGPEGEIAWCAEAAGTGIDDAVLAGNASIYASLGCALKLADLVGEPKPEWRTARASLRRAILCAPHRFDRAGQDRSAYAMDWYYPILAGAMAPAAAFARLETRVATFLKPEMGCHCVSTEPWITVAESSELALAAMRLGGRRQAAALLDWQMAQRDSDGAFWMGWQYEEAIVWPQEKPTWTQAAAILATDALHGATPAARVLVAE